ncbi:ArdC-like ssDNA-binding domain-containing protein [Amnibacterium endophyticum]|uniref:ArdC-like ssDNA-binding domain-containing protein n=1 Tax=Amnibacterium endophyticum TaxID=2109337 RepID=A0ABW4LH52_9MICO
MVRKTAGRVSVKERQAAAAALHESIAVQVEALKASGEWERFLAFAGAFHTYSLSNVLLILSQRPTATKVAGFRKWQELGRQVRRGEKSIRIFGYRTIKADLDDGETAGTPAVDAEGKAGERGAARVVYPMLSVFDIAQTDLIDPNSGDPSALAARLEGDDPAGIADAVAGWLEACGWTLEREALPGPVNGYTATDGSRRVVIDADLSPAQAAKTALHEAAHVLLHTDEEPGEYAAHRGIKETEAESVAYVLAGLLGLDTAAYSIGYVAGWADGDTDLIRGTAARVLSAVHTLADSLTAAAPAAV